MRSARAWRRMLRTLCHDPSHAVFFYMWGLTAPQPWWSRSHASRASPPGLSLFLRGFAKGGAFGADGGAEQSEEPRLVARESGDARARPGWQRSQRDSLLVAGEHRGMDVAAARDRARVAERLGDTIDRAHDCPRR